MCDEERERLLIWLCWSGVKVSMCISFIRQPDTREHHRVRLCVSGGGGDCGAIDAETNRVRKRVNSFRIGVGFQ